MSKSVDVILSAVKAAGEAALRLHEENKTLAAQLSETVLHVPAHAELRIQHLEAQLAAAEREREALRELAVIARQVCDSTAGTQQRTDCIASMRAFLTLRIDAAPERQP